MVTWSQGQDNAVIEMLNAEAVNSSLITWLLRNMVCMCCSVSGRVGCDSIRDRC